MNERQKRLKEVYDYARQYCGIHTKFGFAEFVKYGRTSMSAALNGNDAYLTDNLFVKICAAFPGTFSLDYLLTGEGTLLENNSRLLENNRLLPENNRHLPENTPIVSNTKGKPYYNVDFALGFDLMINDQTSTPDYLIDFQPYNDCDCYCNAHGNSMYPTISSGDIVALKVINDFSYLINGEIYGIVTANGLRTIKRVRDNGDTFTLIADNPDVAEQTIPKSTVTNVFLVKGLIKQF